MCVSDINILYASIVKIIYDMQYLWSVMQRDPNNWHTGNCLTWFHWHTVNIKLQMSPFETYYQRTLPNLALNFCQYMQLITIDWADQNDTMAQQM